jgi:hypothetical protein
MLSKIKHQMKIMLWARIEIHRDNDATTVADYFQLICIAVIIINCCYYYFPRCASAVNLVTSVSDTRVNQLFFCTRFYISNCVLVIYQLK